MDPPERLNIEHSPALLHYLRAAGHLAADEPARVSSLPGGVSNRTVLVEPSTKPPFVLKQALPKLRVATDWPSDPRRIHQEALGLTWLARITPPGSIPALLFEDEDLHVLAIEAVPMPHDNWKTRLLSGGLEMRHVEQFGALLGSIHGRSHQDATRLSRVFADRGFFESLRVEPYYRYTASRHPATRSFFDELIAETAATRMALVHGDYSPKNILIAPSAFVLLDHEVIHWGDPAFDIGFSMTHLLAKAGHLRSQRKAFLDAARLYWKTYRATTAAALLAGGFEQRASRHTAACLLARVDGRSPLEYLSANEQSNQRQIALELIGEPLASMAGLIDFVEARIG
jgi:aminoglycoside phosphotransferase (APT) family kinase protein